MCSWDTEDADVAAFVKDLRAVMGEEGAPADGARDKPLPRA
jgi:hypothetical protein